MTKQRSVRSGKVTGKAFARFRGPARAAVFAGVMAVLAGPASAAGTWHVSTIQYVYPLATGEFNLIFHEPAPTCSSTNGYYRVRVGENGVTERGVDKLFAASLAAAAQGIRVKINFEDSTPSCYVNRLLVIYD